MESSQRERLETALGLAFPDRGSLNRMLTYKLSTSLDHIGDSNDQPSRVNNVVVWALSQHKVYELLSGALAMNREHPELRAIVMELLPGEIDKLREAWKNRAATLKARLDKNEMRELRSSLEKLFGWSSAKAVNPATVPALQLSTLDALQFLVERMYDDIAAGDHLHEVVERTYRDGGENYQQTWWDSQTKELVPKLLEELHKQAVLEKLQKQVGVCPQENASDREVPIIVFAMTALEAKQLADLTAFENYPLEARTAFEDFKAWLAADERTRDWRLRYGDRPEDWRPFGAQPTQDIRQIVTEVFRQFDEDNSTTWLPEFKNIGNLTGPAANPAEHRRQRRQLQDILVQGPLVIVDMVSMHHPTVLRIFQQSALDQCSNARIVAIAPIDDAFAKLRQMSFILQVRVVDLELTKRIDDASQGGSCQEVSKERDFQKWLVDRVKERNPGQSTMYNMMTSIRGQR